MDGYCSSRKPVFISQYQCQKVQRSSNNHTHTNFLKESKYTACWTCPPRQGIHKISFSPSYKFPPRAQRLVWSLTWAPKFLTHRGLFFTLVVSALYFYKFSWFFHLISILVLNNVIVPKIWVFIKTLQCLWALLKIWRSLQKNEVSSANTIESQYQLSLVIILTKLLVSWQNNLMRSYYNKLLFGKSSYGLKIKQFTSATENTISINLPHQNPAP